MMPSSTRQEVGWSDLQIAQILAPRWERQRAFVEEVSAPVREWLVRELAPESAETLLEIAAGAGDSGYEALRKAADGARLISTDQSPAMVEVARRRGAALGVRNVEHRIMDGERLELEDDSVDGILCRFGLMLMADPAAALAEARRVLRQGRRLVLAVWGPPDRNPFFAIAGTQLVQNGWIEPPDPAGPGVFALADHDRLGVLLEEAGFDSVQVEEIPVRFSLDSVDHYLAVLSDTAGALAIHLQDLPADRRASLREQLSERLAPFGRAGGLELPGVAIAARGVPRAR